LRTHSSTLSPTLSLTRTTTTKCVFPHLRPTEGDHYTIVFWAHHRCLWVMPASVAAWADSRSQSLIWQSWQFGRLGERRLLGTQWWEPHFPLLHTYLTQGLAPQIVTPQLCTKLVQVVSGCYWRL
jgi:hypothetical protein